MMKALFASLLIVAAFSLAAKTEAASACSGVLVTGPAASYTTSTYVSHVCVVTSAGVLTFVKDSGPNDCIQVKGIGTKQASVSRKNATCPSIVATLFYAPAKLVGVSPSSKSSSGALRWR